MSVLVTVDGDKCIAGGACAVLCPSVFSLDDGGAVVLLRDTVDDESVALEVQDAADACPGNAISAVSSEGNHR